MRYEITVPPNIVTTRESPDDRRPYFQAPDYDYDESEYIYIESQGVWHTSYSHR